MVRFKAFRFVLLGARQAVKPLVQRIVRVASLGPRPLLSTPPTRRLCILLGRLSFALSAVVAEWGRREAAHQQLDRERQQQFWQPQQPARESEEEATSAKTAKTTTSAKTKTTEERKKEEKKCGAGGGTARERSVRPVVDREVALYMHDALGAVLGKEFIALTRQWDEEDKEREEREERAEGRREKKPLRHSMEKVCDSTALKLDESKGSEAQTNGFTDPAELPLRSSWYVFRRTFTAPFPEYQLVDAGANLLVEFLVYIALALFLSIEISYDARASVREQRRTAAEHDVLAAKINELVAYVNEREGDGKGGDSTEASGETPSAIATIDRVALRTHRTTPLPDTSVGDGEEKRPWGRRILSSLAEALLTVF